MDTISKIQEKINSLLDKREVQACIHVFFVLLLMIISFLLGKISEQPESLKNAKSIQIYLPNGELVTQNTTLQSQSPLSAYILGGAQNAVIPANGPDMSERLNAVETVSSPEESNQLFGSKSGSTYYTPGCKSGNRVKIENRVYFENESAAEDEGYTKSKLCK
jgi:hypothetical protein